MDEDSHYQIPDHVTEIILESISDGVFTVDHQWRITTFNRAAEQITGIHREQAVGKHCWEIFQSNMCEEGCALRRTMKQGKSFIDSSTYIITKEGRRIPVVVSTSLLKDTKGKTLGGVETFRDMSLVEELRKELERRFQISDIVSRNPGMHKIFRILPQVAESDSTVLIQGETGTGKELLARAIHGLSPRRGKPFIAVNCGALPDTLLESEIFGYKKGAFTDAARDKPGFLSTAEEGTILLDEVGDLSAAFQVRLLRVLQDKTYQPLGATKPIKANVRIIAATNRDLADLVEKGLFRQDLFYRINIIRLTLPPLKERREDIPMLVKHFIGRFNRLKGKSVTGISQEALSILMFHDYPGNIRELENIIEHAFVLCPEGEIQIHCLPENLRVSTPRPVMPGSMDAAIKSTETQVILDTLERNSYNQLATARELGIHKSTLFRKIKSLGIDMSGRKGRSGRAQQR
ncbi:PAS domain S-box protein [uncultured Desulfobacterium sp.]|uniref:PAS domain S-box protein n=1 Tax=uncultured Desulfobacterium sp. TaxID=201089 RepID=A0A445MQX9_9BACT|nr:PAS domain S-box protein [uncultured Desulfobacterium sp.]